MSVSRILYIDIDSLRPDHLGCYGYPRPTSPNIDRIARNGAVFDNCFASDTPCAPSRSSLFTGRFGVHNGVVSHSGPGADPIVDTPNRRQGGAELFQSTLPMCLQQAGYHTATFSSFATRHQLYGWLAGFREVHDPGGRGHDIACDITPGVLQWLDAHGADENWFLHVNYWDVHIPYQVPDADIVQFAGESTKQWMTPERFAEYKDLPGLRSFRDTFWARRPAYIDTRLQMKEVQAPADFRKMIDSYDACVAYVDAHVGQIIRKLDELGVSDDVAILIMADHGEDLGERGVIGHGMASYQNTHIPAVWMRPDMTGSERGRRDAAYHYHIDLAASVLDMAGIPIPETWDAAPVGGRGREHLILNNFAQGNQRSVLFRSQTGADTFYTRNYFDIFHFQPPESLFDLAADPHALDSMAEQRQPAVRHAHTLIQGWEAECRLAPLYRDTLELAGACNRAGLRGLKESYPHRLETTGRGVWAQPVRDAFDRL